MGGVVVVVVMVTRSTGSDDDLLSLSNGLKVETRTQRCIVQKEMCDLTMEENLNIYKDNIILIYIYNNLCKLK